MLQVALLFLGITQILAGRSVLVGFVADFPDPIPTAYVEISPQTGTLTKISTQDPDGSVAQMTSFRSPYVWRAGTPGSSTGQISMSSYNQKGLISGPTPIPITTIHGFRYGETSVSSYKDTVYVIGVKNEAHPDVNKTACYFSVGGQEWKAFFPPTSFLKPSATSPSVQNPFVAHATGVWFGYSPYWRGDSDYLIGYSTLGSAPIIVPNENRLRSCQLNSAGVFICTAKKFEARSRTQLVQMDPATGKNTMLCPQIAGFSDDDWEPQDTAMDQTNGDVFYLIGRCRGQEDTQSLFIVDSGSCNATQIPIRFEEEGNYIKNFGIIQDL